MNKKKILIVLILIIIILLSIFIIKACMKANKWYSKYDLIGHALYGIDNKSYTNSYEALQFGYSKGIRVFEADFLLTSDEKLVLHHDWEGDIVLTYKEYMSTKINNKYTPMDIEKLLTYMKENKDIYIVVDTKQEKYDKTKFLNVYSKIIETANEIDSKLLDRFIIQLYRYEDLSKIKQLYDFKDYIFTTYKLSKWSVEELINFCKKNNVETVVCPQDHIYKRIPGDDIKKIKKNKINVFFHTINDIEIYNKFSNDLGIDGIYTDFISG